MGRDKRRTELHHLLLGAGSLMNLSGQSTRRTIHIRRRRRNTAGHIASYWGTVGRYLYQAIDSYSSTEANRR